MSKVTIENIKFLEEIYPRRQHSKKTVESYVEALKAGASFPPVEVQRIRDNSKVVVVGLDGWHRLEAYKQVDTIGEVEVNYWKDEVLDKVEWLEQLRLESAFRNIAHGNRLSSEDRQFQARRIVEANPKIENSLLANKFNVAPQTISEWVSDIRAKFYASRDSKVCKLSLLGWTQEEIGEIFEIPQSNISNIIHSFDKPKTSIINAFWKEKKTIDELCEFYGIDEVLAWAIILGGKSDLERFDCFGQNEEEKKPKIFNVWNFPNRDKRLGLEAKGNIPGQIAVNALYYYTKQGDLVLDPMAGGGSTVDACLVMNRKCRAFDRDLKVVSKRKDIVLRDLEQVPKGEGFGKELLDKVDFVFLDPPYYNMVFDDYENIEDFYGFITTLSQKSYETLKNNGMVAVLIQDMTEKGCYCLSGETYKIFLKTGFSYVDHVSTPLTANVEHDERQENERRLIGRNRDLYIFRKS